MNDQKSLPVYREMTERFQCPGCVAGSDTECGEYVRNELNACANHVLGTSILGLTNFALGLPKGFCRPGHGLNTMAIRLYRSPDDSIAWNRSNVAVWAIERDGYLFVRTYAPRINQTSIDIVKDGTLALVPGAIDVGEFYNEID